MTSFTTPKAMAIAISLALGGAGVALGDGSTLPPSWQRGRAVTDDENAGGTRGRRQRTPPPWYVPRFAAGVGLSIPEVLPLEGYAFFGRYFALRVFYTPPLPVNVRVEMPSDVISTKKGVGVAHPDFTIRLKATYGAHYGAEALAFPDGGSFFLMAGASRRRMRLVGDAKSPVLVCSLIEAAKDPPCGDPDAAIETRTELELKADVETQALLARAGLGWFWHVGQSGYFLFNAGYTKPMRVSRRIDVESALDTPAALDPEITGALAQVKAEREADLEHKAVREMRPVDERPLPILGLAAGLRF